MNPTTEPAFTYEGFAKADQEWLITQAAALKCGFRNTVSETMKQGDILFKAQRRLGRKWLQWLSHVEVPRRTATRLIAVHRAFGKAEPTVLERFTPTALYILSECGIPQSLREYAIEQVEDTIANRNGFMFNGSDASELLA